VLGEVANFGTFYFLLKIKILRNANLNLPQNSQLLDVAFGGMPFFI
jgi:hypothetical protein